MHNHQYTSTHNYQYTTINPHNQYTRSMCNYQSTAINPHNQYTSSVYNYQFTTINAQHMSVLPNICQYIFGLAFLHCWQMALYPTPHQFINSYQARFTKSTARTGNGLILIKTQLQNEHRRSWLNRYSSIGTSEVRFPIHSNQWLHNCNHWSSLMLGITRIRQELTRIISVSRISCHGASGPICQWGSTIMSPWMRTVTSRCPSSYDLTRR